MARAGIPTGVQPRFEETTGAGLEKLAERESMPRLKSKNIDQGLTCEVRAALRLSKTRRRHVAGMRADRERRASGAWPCSNLRRDDRALNSAWIYSIASTDPACSWPRNRGHKLREQLSAQPRQWIYQYASLREPLPKPSARMPSPKRRRLHPASQGGSSAGGAKRSRLCTG